MRLLLGGNKGEAAGERVRRRRREVRKKAGRWRATAHASEKRRPHCNIIRPQPTTPIPSSTRFTAPRLKACDPRFTSARRRVLFKTSVKCASTTERTFQDRSRAPHILRARHSFEILVKMTSLGIIHFKKNSENMWDTVNFTGWYVLVRVNFCTRSLRYVLQRPAYILCALYTRGGMQISMSMRAAQKNLNTLF